MPACAKLAIIERLNAADDPSAVMIDLHMMVITGGRARAFQELDALLAQAGLSASGVVCTASGLCVIEAVPGA